MIRTIDGRSYNGRAACRQIPPNMSSLAMFPATRALKMSPMPRSMITSAGALESMQLSITAEGYWPLAAAFCSLT
jgi:hypothetical protein